MKPEHLAPEEREAWERFIRGIIASQQRDERLALDEQLAWAKLKGSSLFG